MSDKVDYRREMLGMTYVIETRLNTLGKGMSLGEPWDVMRKELEAAEKELRELQERIEVIIDEAESDEEVPE